MFCLHLFLIYITFKQLNYGCCKGIFYMHRINTFKNSTHKASFLGQRTIHPIFCFLTS